MVKESTEDKETELVPIAPDCREYTDQFACLCCQCIIQMYTYMKECNYNFCPYCGTKVK